MRRAEEKRKAVLSSLPATLAARFSSILRREKKGPCGALPALWTRTKILQIVDVEPGTLRVQLGPTELEPLQTRFF